MFLPCLCRGLRVEGFSLGFNLVSLVMFLPLQRAKG